MYLLKSQILTTCILVFLIFTGNANADSGRVPDLLLNTAQGKLKLSELQGQVVYVDFWASWCDPCRKSFPWMNTLQKRFAKAGFKIVAINVDTDISLARKFLNEHPASFTIAFDPDGAAAEAFKVKGMPNSYLIDRKGNVHSSHIGFREKDVAGMEAEIKTLLKQ